MSIHLSNINVSRPPYLGGKKWELTNLSDVTIIFGKNGSGKSLLLRKLRDEGGSTGGDAYSYISPERGGELQHDLGIMQEELAAVRKQNRRQTNMASTYRQEAISRIQALLIKMGNISGRKGNHKVNLGDIENLINSLLPNFKFKIKEHESPYELERLLPQEIINSVNKLSSGESEILALALDTLITCEMWKLDNKEKRILLIDEPDTHLHPDLQQHLAKFLIDLLDKYKVQIIIATHSTTLLSALGYHGGDQTSIIYLNNSVEKQRATKFDKILLELSACLGGHVLMGPLFGYPLLLVEGDDDYQAWCEVARNSSMKLAVIPCKGDEITKYQETLEKIFTAIHDDTTPTLGYVIRDGDKSIPPENQFKFIKCLKLNCHELENLFLTNEVLSELDFNWETAKTKIKNKSDEFGNKKGQLASVDSLDRKNGDIKNVINELSKILDEKNVRWTIRIGKCIGKNRPSGELKDFLGDNVVNALWGTEK